MLKTKGRKAIILALGAVLVVCGSVLIANLLTGRSAAASPSITEAVAKNETGASPEFMAAYRTDNLVRAEFCYLLPTSEDWGLGRTADDAILIAGDETYPLWGGKLSLPEKNFNEAGQKRCSTLFFEVPAERALGKVTFQIKRMVTSLPDVYDCEQAQHELDQSEKYSGIQIQCRSGDHTSGFDIINKPAEMSESEARTIVVDEIFSHSIYGPWSFEADIQ